MVKIGVMECWSDGILLEKWRKAHGPGLKQHGAGFRAKHLL